MTSKKFSYAPDANNRVCKALEVASVRSSEILYQPNIKIAMKVGKMGSLKSWKCSSRKRKEKPLMHSMIRTRRKYISSTNCLRIEFSNWVLT